MIIRHSSSPIAFGRRLAVAALVVTRFNIMMMVLLVHAASAASTSSSPLFADLPWEDLKAKLAAGTKFIDATPSDYLNECSFVFELPPENRTNHDLIDQPSGVCMNHFFCGFSGGCNPIDVQGRDLSVRQKWEAFGNDFADYGTTWLDGSTNPNNSYNIPPKVLFPQVAGDVYAAVEFAMNHSIQLSVKNSGHSYTGASTKSDTLHLNMNQFQRYSSNAESSGLLECGDATDDEEDSIIAADLGNQPCQLARARNKPAVLRVGGGENFDKVYRAVKAYNEANGDGEYKYHLVGGAAGTVSPMGWTWQGGLSGTTNGRNYGFGVDQVLQVEMVLPLGQHVKFGPTQWETVEGFQYPKTTQVTGVCNANPYGENESEWVWTTTQCGEDIKIEMLWFAVNGGSGGTYGVVTSVYLQLHEYVAPASTMIFGNGALTVPPCGLSQEDSSGPLGQATWSFLIDFLHDPVSLGIPANISNACAAPAFRAFVAGVWCYGDGVIDAMLSSWAGYLADRNQTLVESGVPVSSIETAATCFGEMVANYVDYPEAILIPEGRPHAGKAEDNPKPAYPSTTEFAANVLIPRKFILENKETVIGWLMGGAPSYWAFGGNTATAQDQSNSLSDAHREAGLMLFLPLDSLDESFYSDIFPLMYDVTNGNNNFPGFVGSNHAGPNTRGPLKDDFSKPCSLDWTQKERDDKCVSLQEAIWGTEKLARLEAVKDAVDPNRMLDCYGCVGNNNRVLDTTTTTTTMPTSSPPGESGATTTAIPTSSPPSESSAPLTAAALSTTAAFIAALFLSNVAHGVVTI